MTLFQTIQNTMIFKGRLFALRAIRLNANILCRAELILIFSF
jgi:hypothetical protein